MRDVAASKDAPYAWFLLTSPEGRVVLAEADRTDGHRFVNSSLSCFVTSLKVFESSWPETTQRDLDLAAAAVTRLKSAMVKLDPAAFADSEAYWPMWFEELES